MVVAVVSRVQKSRAVGIIVTRHMNTEKTHIRDTWDTSDNFPCIGFGWKIMNFSEFSGHKIMGLL